MRGKRILQRMRYVANHSLGQLLPGIFNLALSIIIIRKLGTGSWGEIVFLQVCVHLALAIAAYGNKEFLLKAFSENPASISSYYTLSLGSRSVLLLPLLLLLWFALPLDDYLKGSALVWLLARYISNSFEAYILYTRRFFSAILMEAIPSSALILILLLQRESSFEQVIFYFSAAYLLKAVLGIVFFRTLYSESSFSFSAHYFKVSFAFAALSLTGILQSRADLFTVGILMPQDSLGAYQVLTAFLGLMHGLPGFIVAPFVSNFYRGNRELGRKLKRNVIIGGFFISALGIAMVSVLIPLLYPITFGIEIYVLAFIYVFSSYLFYLDIYSFYSRGKAQLVLIISITAAAANIAACFILIPWYGIQGAMLANIASQLLLWAFFSYSSKSIEEDAAE